MKNITRHRDIKLVTTGKRKNYLVSEPNYHTTKFFTENLLAIEINVWVLLWFGKTKILWKGKIVLHGYRQCGFIH